MYMYTLLLPTFCIFPNKNPKFYFRVKDRLTVHFVTSYRRFNWYQNRPGYRGFKIISENLVVIFEMQKTVYCKKPLQIGACILDFSKYLMYEKWFNFIIPSFDKVQLLMTDVSNCFPIWQMTKL